MSITLRPLEEQHLQALKTLNSVIFPVKYHERVYQDALACGPVSQLAFDGDTLIGASMCRLEALVGDSLQGLHCMWQSGNKRKSHGTMLLVEMPAYCAYRQPFNSQPGGAAQLYILSLGVLAPYRSSGIGSKLLAESLAVCEDDPAIQKALLHVHTANTDALEFYQHKGFQVVETIAGYYKRLDPPDAVVLVKLLHEEHAGGAAPPRQYSNS